MDDREEGRCCFFVSGCDSAPLLEASPEVLNEMPTPISPLWAGDRRIASFCRNGGPGSHVPYPFTEDVRCIALVRHDPQGNGGEAIEHGWRQG